MLWTSLRRAGLLALAAAALLPSPAAADTAAVRADGTVLFDTTTRQSSEPKSVLLAVRPDGTLDPGFGDGGVVRNHDADVPGDVVVMPDGSAYVLRGGGGCPNASPHNCTSRSVLTRHGDDGAVLDRRELVNIDDSGGGLRVLERWGEGLLEADDAFMGFGVVRRLDGEGEDVDVANVGGEEGGPPFLTTAAVAGDGVALGLELGPEDWKVARLDAELEPVTTYGEDGRADVPFEPTALAADGDELVVAGGDQVTRLQADGTPDPDFGTAGVATVAAIDVASLVALDGGGVLVAGSTTGGSRDFAVARLLPNGTPDPEFGVAGVATVDFNGRDDQLEGLLALEAGALVLTGGSNEGVDRRAAAARLTADGELDESFGEDGRFLATVDVRPPAVELVEPAPPAEGLLTVDGPLRVSVSADEEATLTCRVGTTSLPCTDTPAEFGELPHGYHGLTVTAVDAHGNEDQEEFSIYVLPRTAFDTTPAALSNAGSAGFAWSTRSGPDGTFECRLDGGEWAACESPRTLSGLADGSHVFEVRQAFTEYDDRLVEPSPARWEWTVDTRPPVTSLRGGGSLGRDAAIEFAVDDPEARSECRLDGGEWAACASPVRYSGLGPGRHVVEIVSIDRAGNREERGTSVSWVVDAPPTGQQPPAGPTLAQRRAAAAAGLEVAASRGRRARRGVSVSVASAVAARVRVSGSVKVGKRRLALRAFSGSVAAGSSVRARLKVPARTLRALRRSKARRVAVRLRVALAEADGTRLVTRTITVRVAR